MFPVRNAPGNAGQERLQRRVDEFTNDSRSTKKRFQSLNSILSAGNDGDIKAFFQQQYFRIYAVMFDVFSTCEAHFKYKGLP
jgi:hypothetical protein